MRAFFVLLAVLASLAPTFAADAPPVDARNSSLLALKREQIALWQDEIERAGRFAPASWLEALRQSRARALQIQNTSGDAATAPPNYIQERAYFARNDGSPQPYYLALPVGYTPLKKWPLVLFLHGYSPSISKINPWLPSLETIQSAQKRGFILAMPYGRRNSDFVQWGQDDVMRVREEVTRLFSVDEGRTFLLGASMGGYGAYATALHTAGTWAGVAPISGRSDFYLWFGIKREELPPWKRILFDADDPRTLALNARNTPILVQHGALDGVVPVEHSRLMAADARVLGLPLRYIEQSDGTHYSEFQEAAMERALDWFEQRPALAPPRALTVIAGDLREAKAHWARIEAFGDYSQMARLDVNAQADKISVKTRNVARFALDVPPTFFEPNTEVMLEVDGTSSPLDVSAPIIWQAPNARLGKTPARTGPFKSLMRDRFLLVYGNADDARAARHFADRWQAWTDGQAPVKSAANISPSDKTDANLILFGTRATNLLIAEIADRLPLELTENGYRIGDQTVVAPYIGLRMVWQSPWDSARLIGICSGENWGQGLPFNHVWDLVPDYIVYSYQTELDGTNRALEAGFFNGDWALEQ